MINVQEFRQKARDGEIDYLLNDVLLASSAKHVSLQNIGYLKTALAAKFSIQGSEVNLWVVGSAKLGFSIIEKRKEAVTLPRYRPFSIASDIDLAVVSPTIFDLVWDELAGHAHRATKLPWDSGRLGDYLVCGWLRPDHFPLNARLRRCDDWWDLFRGFSADARYGRRKMRGGLFHSESHMKRYLARAIDECVLAERLVP